MTAVIALHKIKFLHNGGTRLQFRQSTSAAVHSDVRLNISSTFQERQLLMDILKKIKKINSCWEISAWTKVVG